MTGPTFSDAAVRLDLPADSGASFVARVVAAWMMAENGATIDAIEDARLAVDEVVAAMISAGSAVSVAFAEHDGSVYVEIENQGPVSKVELSAMAARIVEVITATWGPLHGDRDGYLLRLRGPAV